MKMNDYFIFGCGIYVNKGMPPQHTFWIEDRITGNSELLYVNWEQYFKNTNIDISPQKSTILNCDNCCNKNCKYHKSFNNNQKATVDIDKLFLPDPFLEKRQTRRLNLMLSVKLYSLINIADKTKNNLNNFITAKITNLSSSGCNISFEKLPEEKIPDIENNINIQFLSNVIIRKKSSNSIDSKFYNLKNISHILGEITWRVQYNCGIQFLSMKKEDRFTIEDMIGDLYNI